jgi:hypothetical protein
MPTWLEKTAARLGFLHAGLAYRRFQQRLAGVASTQEQVLARSLRLVTDSDFGRRHRLRSVRSRADLRRAVPLQSYEDLRPVIDRVAEGDTSALFSRPVRVLMLATSSGTTARRKLIPVTPQYVRDYRRGWNIFGLKVLRDHPEAILRTILQVSGRFDESRTSCGIPIGAITGLLAVSQKAIVRRFYAGNPLIARIEDPRARYYALVRFGIVRDVAFAVTASPATLIRIAQIANEESERLIRDVRDGTLSGQIVSDGTLRRQLESQLTPLPERARELEAIRRRTGLLAPRDYWRLAFLCCWTGGSMGLYQERLRSWYGLLPIRDVGLLASEGRVSIPLEDNTPVGVLDVTSAVFEFIPFDEAESAQPRTLYAEELEPGHEYVVVLTNTSGLVRYRLDDVVRAHGKLGGAPLVEFKRRFGGVSSIAGEKLTEAQLVEAVKATCRQFQIPHFDFIAAPCWSDPPFYRISCAASLHPAFAEALDAALCRENEEYASRRRSGRLGSMQVRILKADTIDSMDLRIMATRRSSAEQYKRLCLLPNPGDDDRALGLTLPSQQSTGIAE